MDEISKTVKIGYYLDIFSRRRWYIIIPFCIVMAIGIYLAIMLPKIYMATTVLFYEPQEVPEDFVRSIQSTVIRSTIDHISQQIVSSENLEKIIRQFILQPKHDYDEMKINSMIEGLRSQISVDLVQEMIQGDVTTDTFSISFEGENPEKVMNITNALATLFIEKRLETRKEKAIDTSTFLEEEIQAKRKELEAFEQKIKDFREKHMGGLPEQLQTNLLAIERLEKQLDVKQEHILDAKNRLILLNNQLAEIRTLQQNIYLADADEDQEMNPFVRLMKMKLELEDLKSRYTPQHPDVIRLKLKIEELEQQIQAGSVELPQALKHNLSMEQLDQFSPMLVEQRRSLERQVRAIKLEIETLNTESSKILNDIAKYQKLVDATPLREQELQLLQRDYRNERDNYNLLLERKSQAKLAVSLEKKRKGERFSIVSRARLPLEPVKPNMKILFLFTITIALHLGPGLVFLLEYFNSTIRQVKDLESDLGIPVLVSIPKIYTVKDKVNYSINKVLTYASVVIAFTLCVVFALLVLNGVEPTMEMINELLSS